MSYYFRYRSFTAGPFRLWINFYSTKTRKHQIISVQRCSRCSRADDVSTIGIDFHEWRIWRKSKTRLWEYRS